MSWPSSRRGTSPRLLGRRVLLVFCLGLVHGGNSVFEAFAQFGEEHVVLRVEAAEVSLVNLRLGLGVLLGGVEFSVEMDEAISL